MNRSEYMAIRPQFLSKYVRKYDSALSIPEIQAGIAERIIKDAQEDVDDQFQFVLKTDGDTAYINLYGPMSEDGPDWIDLYFGYNGTAYKNLIRASEEILKNDAIKQVIVNGNTPGGNIDGLDAAYQSLLYLAERRPVTAINRGMIASAGVWYTSAANEIIASTPSAMIGSIGVVIDTLDFTGYYDELGIKEISITNTDSPNKRPDLLTEAGKNIYIKELDALYKVFLNRVITGTTASESDIKNLKGEMIIAADAVKIGLMAGIEGEAEASEQAGSEPKTASKKTTKKETKMDEDVKQAFETLTGSVNSLVEALKPKSIETATIQSTELSANDKKFALNIATGDAYPKNVKDEAAKVLAGDSEIATLKAMTAAVDAVKETQAGAEAEGEGDETGETQPTGKIPTGVKKPKEADGTIDTEEEAAAEIKRIKGEA